MRALLLITVTMACVMGLVMVFSTTSAEILDHDLERDATHALIRQMLYALAGMGIAYGASKIGYRGLIRYSPIFLFFISVALVLVLIPGIGKEVNGAKRWLSIAGLSIQPSEFVKYIAPAYFIYRRINWKGSLPLAEFLRWVGILSIPILLILVEPNNGTAGVIIISLIALFFMTGVPVKYWAYPLIALALIGGFSASKLPYVSARLKVYLDPESDIQGRGHQPLQAKIAAGSGGFLGRGPGKSLQKLSYLPEAQNDYIAAIFAEEFGFLGISSLIFLYLLIAYIGFAIAYRCPDPAGFYLASAITFLIAFQAFMNLGVVSGLLPSTGLNLPLFSQGGSSLMANIIGIGILLNIEKEKSELTSVLG